MTQFEQLQKDFKEMGFEINDDEYTLDRVTYQTIQVNGRVFKQPEHHILKMIYIGNGCEVGDSDSEIEDTEFYEFSFVDSEGNQGDVICIKNIEDFKFFVNG